MKALDPKALQARLAALEAALEDIRHAVWTPNSTLPMVRHRVALILTKLDHK